MKNLNLVATYTKSIDSSYNYLYISLVFILVYTFFNKNLSGLSELILKYSSILLLVISVYIIFKTNFNYIYKLKDKIYYSKYKNLRSSIFYNTILGFFMIFLIYHFIYL